MATLTAGAVAAMTPPQVIERAHAALLKVYRDLRLQSGGVGQTKLEEDLEEVLVLLQDDGSHGKQHLGGVQEGSFVVKKNFTPKN